MRYPGKPYEVNIVVKKASVQETEQGHVPLAHGDEYGIELVNSDMTRRCSAQVTIDGKNVGTFVVGAYKSCIIERHAEIARVFQFFAAGTPEAQQAGLNNTADENLGVVSIKFVPEKYTPMPDHGSSLRMMGGGQLRSMGFSPGGTGLGRDSDQRFRTVSFVGDDTQAVTLSVRLVHQEKAQQEPKIIPLVDVNGPVATPVPPPAPKRN